MWEFRDHRDSERPHRPTRINGADGSHDAMSISALARAEGGLATYGLAVIMALDARLLGTRNVEHHT